MCYPCIPLIGFVGSKLIESVREFPLQTLLVMCFNTDDSDAAVLDTFEWWLMPLGNPDGYAYTVKPFDSIHHRP